MLLVPRFVIMFDWMLLKHMYHVYNVCLFHLLTSSRFHHHFFCISGKGLLFCTGGMPILMVFLHTLLKWLFFSHSLHLFSICWMLCQLVWTSRVTVFSCVLFYCLHIVFIYVFYVLVLTLPFFIMPKSCFFYAFKHYHLWTLCFYHFGPW